MTEEKGVVGVIVAMRKELDSIRESMTDVSVETISGIPFASGELEGHRVVVALSGVGKVFAAICTQTMIFRYHPSLIVNTGIAGTLMGEAGIGDVVVATDVVQHDMDTSPIGDPVGLISGINVIHIDTDAEASACFCRAAEAAGLKTVRGTVASGDQFVASRERKAEIVALFGGAACEMEGAAVGQVWPWPAAGDGQSPSFRMALAVPMAFGAALQLPQGRHQGLHGPGGGLEGERASVAHERLESLPVQALPPNGFAASDAESGAGARA